MKNHEKTTKTKEACKKAGDIAEESKRAKTFLAG